MKRFGWMGPLREEAGDGGGGGGGGGLTLEQVTAAINVAVNGLDKRYAKQFKGFEDKLKPADPPAEPEPEPDKGGKPDPQSAKLQKQLEALTGKLEAAEAARKDADAKAEQKERDSLLRAELSRFQFAKDSGAGAAFKLLSSDVKRAEDGALVAGEDEQPIGEFVKAQLEGTYDYLLAPRSVGGAGASGGGRGKSPVVGLEDIKSGMTTETKQAALDQIRAALAS